jgi:hypothetical protein
MIRIQEFTGDQMKLEQFLNTDAVRLGWKVLSVQKINAPIASMLGYEDSWVVTFEKEEA